MVLAQPPLGVVLTSTPPAPPWLSSMPHPRAVLALPWALQNWPRPGKTGSGGSPRGSDMHQPLFRSQGNYCHLLFLLCLWQATGQW